MRVQNSSLNLSNKMKGRKKGSPNITQKVKNTIIFAASQEDRPPASKVRKFLLDYRDMLHLSKTQVPQIRAIQGVINKNSDKIQKLRDRNKDKPWSLLRIDDQIHPELLPVIIHSWFHARDTGHVLTQRESNWVIRLSGIYGDNIADLTKEAIGYSFMEIMFELTGSELWVDDTEYIRLYERIAERKLSQNERKKILSEPDVEPIRKTAEDIAGNYSKMKSKQSEGKQ